MPWHHQSMLLSPADHLRPGTMATVELSAGEYVCWSAFISGHIFPLTICPGLRPCRKRRLLSAKEQHYWTTKLLGCAGSSKLLWRCLNSALLCNNVTSASHSTLTAQALADFFVDKVARVRAVTLHCPLATFTGPCPVQLNDFRSCTLAELHQIITQSPCKSCHLDHLPHTLLMGSLDQVLPFLNVLCNSSLTSGMLQTVRN